MDETSDAAHRDEIEFYRQRLVDLAAERDLLRATLNDWERTVTCARQLEAERDRLRAVVDALRRHRWQEVVESLAALDGSEVRGDA